LPDSDINRVSLDSAANWSPSQPATALVRTCGVSKSARQCPPPRPPPPQEAHQERAAHGRHDEPAIAITNDLAVAPGIF
jgi:hypothetical protein